jgi:hypothetical protein
MPSGRGREGHGVSAGLLRLASLPFRAGVASRGGRRPEEGRPELLPLAPVLGAPVLAVPDAAGGLSEAASGGVHAGAVGSKHERVGEVSVGRVDQRDLLPVPVGGIGHPQRRGGHTTRLQGDSSPVLGNTIHP